MKKTDETETLLAEMSEWIGEFNRLNHQTRLLGINIAVEAAKQSGDVRRAMELVSSGVTDVANAYTRVIQRFEQRYDLVPVRRPIPGKASESSDQE